MRVFEMQQHGNVWRHEFADNNSRSHSFCISGPCAGNTGAIRDLVEVLRDAIGWREVTPFDITKLDCAGVFHEAKPKKPEPRFFYDKWDASRICVDHMGEGIDEVEENCWIEFPRPDIANATIAELRRLLRLAVKDCERNPCHHETTFRGGAIWTICDDCGQKWADDRGGFKPYQEPKWLTEATAILAGEVRT